MNTRLTVFGFAAAFCGDWFLAIRHCGVRTPGFLCGVTAVGGVLSAGFFVWAMLVCPGGHYNPLFYMLSYLGRTTIRDVAYPLSHYLFCFGMVAGSAASLYFALAFDRMGKIVFGWMALVAVAFETALALDKADILPFAPYVPTLQKTIIVSFMLWQLCYAFRIRNLIEKNMAEEQAGTAECP